MFFTRVGYVVACLVFGLGALTLVMGFSVALSDNDLLAGRYVGSKTIAQTIDRGLYAMIFGIGLGVLCEISMATIARLNKH